MISELLSGRNSVLSTLLESLFVADYELCVVTYSSPDHDL